MIVGSNFKLLVVFLGLIAILAPNEVSSKSSKQILARCSNGNTAGCSNGGNAICIGGPVCPNGGKPTCEASCSSGVNDNPNKLPAPTGGNPPQEEPKVDLTPWCQDGQGVKTPPCTDSNGTLQCRNSDPTDIETYCTAGDRKTCPNSHNYPVCYRTTV